MLWTPEVRSSKTGEEWLRRFQSVVFSPMAMINAWSNGTKPWSFPEVAEQVKEYAILRMRMMPYWYTEFARYHLMVFLRSVPSIWNPDLIQNNRFVWK